MKKIAIFIVSMFLLLVAVKPVHAQKEFSDIKTNHWAKESIDFLIGKGIIQGYPDNSFKPNQNITRLQTAIMITKALDLDTSNVSTTSIYSDVPINMSGYEFIAAVTEEGIFNGSNGKFNPNKPLTRAQMAVILSLMYDINVPWEKDFKDVSTKHWAYQSIESIADYGITGGYPDGSFKPNNPTTRAQFSVFMHKVLKNNDLVYSSPKDRLTPTKELEPERQSEPETINVFTFKGIVVGDSKEKVVNTLGEPKRIDDSRKNYKWHIYSDDQESLQIGIQDNEVVALFTNSDIVNNADGLQIHQSTSEEVFNTYGEESIHPSRGTTLYPISINGYLVNFYFDKHFNESPDINKDSLLSGIFIQKKDVSSTVKGVENSMLRDWEKEIFEYTNAFRYKHGINSLKYHEKATITAREHSVDMHTNNFFSHNNLEGLSPFDRMKNNGITYLNAGENIAYMMGVDESFELYYLWVNSYGHRTAMLSDSFTHLGVGLDGEDRTAYATQNFVTPR